MNDVELVPAPAFPDEHPMCPCDSPTPMSFNADTGQVECHDCLTAAEVTP